MRELSGWEFRILALIETLQAALGVGLTLDVVEDTLGQMAYGGYTATALEALRDACLISEGTSRFNEPEYTITEAGRTQLKARPKQQGIEGVRDGLMRELDRLEQLMTKTRQVWLAADFNDDDLQPLDFLQMLQERYLIYFEQAAAAYETYCRNLAEGEVARTRNLDEIWQWLELCHEVDLTESPTL